MSMLLMHMIFLRVTLKRSALLYFFTEFCNKSIYRIRINLFSDLVHVTINRCIYVYIYIFLNREGGLFGHYNITSILKTSVSPV